MEMNNMTMKPKKIFPNTHRVWWSGNEDKKQIVYKNADYFDEWCDEMNDMGYDVVEYDGGTHETIIHTPEGTVVWCYPYWRLVKREVVA